MKKSKSIYAAIAAALLAGAIGASAQSDSSNVPPLRGSPMVDLSHQVRQELSTYTVANSAGFGGNSADASVDCGGGGVMISGGGYCQNGIGLVALSTSQPNGNGWYAACGDPLERGGVTVNVYAVCSRN